MDTIDFAVRVAEKQNDKSLLVSLLKSGQRGDAEKHPQALLLESAVLTGSRYVVKRLVLDGFDPMTKDESGRGLPHFAASMTSEDMFRLALDKGWCPNAKDSFGHTPLFSCLSCLTDEDENINRTISYVSFLLSLGVSPKEKNWAGFSAMEIVKNRTSVRMGFVSDKMLCGLAKIESLLLGEKGQGRKDSFL